MPVGLLSLKSSMETEWPVLIAGLALSCVPVVIVYLLFQKQLIRDMTSGGVKDRQEDWRIRKMTIQEIVTRIRKDYPDINSVFL